MGALAALIPGVPIIDLLVGLQVFNGLLLPIVLGFIVLLASNRRVMGSLANTPLQSVLGWLTLAAVTASAALLLATQFL